MLEDGARIAQPEDEVRRAMMNEVMHGASPGGGPGGGPGVGPGVGPGGGGDLMANGAMGQPGGGGPPGQQQGGGGAQSREDSDSVLSCSFGV